MASHSELRPADSALALMLASAAMEKASQNTTVLTGSVIVDNGDGTQTWIGGSGADQSTADESNGVIENVGDTIAPGAPVGLSLSCVDCRVHVAWNGSLEGGVPADFGHITIYANATDMDEAESWGTLNCAGVIIGRRMEPGTIVDITATAEDTAHAADGSAKPNVSAASDPLSIIVEADASMADIVELDEKAKEISKKADTAAANADKVRSDLQAEVDSVKADVTEVANTASGAMSKATSVEQTADGIKTTISKDYTTTADADKKYSTKTELTTEAGKIRTELSETTTIANGALSKATSLESTVDGISTKISEQATTLDATVKTANEAKSTADSNKTTISQVSTTASSALSKATSLESNLDGFKTTVSETYATKSDMESGDSTVQANVDQLAADAMSTYVQSSTFTQTRDSFTQELSQTKQDVTDANTAIAANEETRKQYLRFSGADSGDPQIELGASDSAFKMRLTNQQLAFMQGDATPAYLSNQRLYINNAEVNQTLRIGKYAFIPRSDGHMSLQYVG